MSFVDDVLAGTCTPDDIDDYVGYWHDGAGAGLPIYKYLGLTRFEYARWVEQPDSLAGALERRRSAASSPATDNFAFIIAEMRRREAEERERDDRFRRVVAEVAAEMSRYELLFRCTCAAVLGVGFVLVVL